MRATRILALLLLALPASCFFWKSAPQPNVLVISVDSLRFDAISRSLGAAQTPNIQALAADGVAFSWCFSHSPMTLPATAALFSSHIPSENHITNNGLAVSEKLPLLADWLAKHGYQTLASVSLSTLWPLEPHDEPSEQHADVIPPRERAKKQGIERGFQIYRNIDRELGTAEEVNLSLLPLDGTLRAGQPWFVFAQYSEPHEPYESHGSRTNTARIELGSDLIGTVNTSDTQWLKKDVVLAPGVHKLKIRSDADFTIRRIECAGPDGEITPRLESGSFKDTFKSAVVVLENPGTTPMKCTLDAWIHDVASVEEARRRYKLEVECVDRAIGALLDELRAKHQYDDTCIVLTADHGGALGEHGKVGQAANLYDEMLRVPLIVKPPKSSATLPALQKLQHAIVRHIDVAPTILDLVDCPPLPDAQGISLLNPEPRVLAAEVHPPEAESSFFAMRDARYKLVYSAAESRFEMFDLSSDTLEMDDVFALQGHYRTSWQAELRMLAASAPQLANARMGLAPKGSSRIRSLGY